MTVDAILIPIEGKIEMVQLDAARSCLPALQALVKGDIESVPVMGRQNLALMINDNGKPYGEYEGLPRNERATRLCRDEIGPEDWIAGPAVIVQLDEMGETTSVPFDLLMEAEAKA